MNKYENEQILFKFQELLRELFQFESSDLDFGIYRILNYKRKEIEKFINEGLKDKVESAFAKHRDERFADIEQKFEEIKQKVIENLGEDAITPSGDIKEGFKDTPIGKEFLSIKERKEEAEKIEEIKLQVFNDLYNFFSRYYEDGDFIPQYRYSIKKHKYAIPYNGEEVKLYWVNYDQYYTKTGLLFRDYTFKVKEYKVIFRVVEAKEELNSNKATKERFFVLDDNPITYEDKTLIICFQYRELTEEEVKHYEVGGGSNTSKQEKINQKSYEEILGKLKDNSLKEYLSNIKSEKPLLLYHLNRFSAKNTRDYFIHKNLKKFLSEQLDYFIKSEVLDIETIERDKYFDKHITRVKVVREIGEAIIDFLSQIEDFQKKLWEKKKFVLKTEYVITLDKIQKYAGENFLKEILDEILKNDKQLEEWRNLGFGEIKSKEDLYLKNNLLEKEYKKLPIDTRYFPLEFKEKLLEKLTENSDLDDLLDGLLIKSENYQALNTILPKFKEKIQTIYIDPPYNTGSDGFLYKDRYQHSTWLTMIENRLSLARELMSEDGVIFVSIDDNEVDNLLKLLKEKFSLVIPLHWRRNKTPQLASKTVATRMEFVLYGAMQEIKLIRERQSKVRPLFNFDGREYRIFEIPEGIIVKCDKLSKGKIYAKRNKKNWIEILDDPIINQGVLMNKIRIKGPWRKIDEELQKVFKNKLIFINSSGFPTEILDEEDAGVPVVKTNELIIEGCYNETAFEELTQKIFTFSSELVGRLRPKPTCLITHLLNSVSTLRKNSIILDFFAGSGTTAHAVMKLNKEDGGKRKFILVEMADYFDTVIIPRIKKVAYSFNWKDGKPQDNDGIGVFCKYYELEQYEQALANTVYEDNDIFTAGKNLYERYLFLKDEKMLRALEIDCENNKVRVNLSKLYPNIDIAETLSNLKGKWIKRIEKDKVIFEDGEEINIQDLDYKHIKPLIWWE
ncbi:MAG: site-specific DNA-methyltransferase [Candidatus Aenigmatarchaeota archaeon]